MNFKVMARRENRRDLSQGKVGVKKALYEEMGKYLLDVSKLIFGGVILAGVMNLEVDKIVLFLAGGVSVVFSAIVGLVLFKKGKE